MIWIVAWISIVRSQTLHFLCFFIGLFETRIQIKQQNGGTVWQRMGRAQGDSIPKNSVPASRNNPKTSLNHNNLLAREINMAEPPTGGVRGVNKVVPRTLHVDHLAGPLGVYSHNTCACHLYTTYHHSMYVHMCIACTREERERKI